MNKRLLIFCSVCCAAQSLSDLPRLKNFSAHRVSSDNPFVKSNDDSKRIFPGETFVMADLRGPGVVSHIWGSAPESDKIGISSCFPESHKFGSGCG